MLSKQDLSSHISSELSLSPNQISVVLDLFDEGATVPFIARYRKDKTGGLDEVQIRTIGERRDYLNDLDDRRHTILTSIEEQGKLTPELKRQIMAADTKTTLEDLYLPYKPKRRTRAMIAREKGLEPLAQAILTQPMTGSPEESALAYICAEKGVATVQEALDGANDIIAEIVSEKAEIRDYLRQFTETSGDIVSTPTEKADGERSKFEQYYNAHTPVTQCHGHQFLAIRRGETEGFLRAQIAVDEEEAISHIAGMMQYNASSPFASFLFEACRDAYERLLSTSIESDVRVKLKQTADVEAVDVFAKNVENLLLAPPLGAQPVVAIDPGIRTGCKCAALDCTGKYLDSIVIFPQTKERQSTEQLMQFISKYRPKAIAIGNGTAGRETEAFVRKTVADMPSASKPYVVLVSESGASIYSASDIAREEFPELDLTIRGAISIGRRLQDPLAELVKIDPKSIGVGQYQHDVFQPLLKRKLEEVVESCVNRVGVELNTASAELLKYVAGIGPSMAKKIVAYREQNGNFQARAQLLKVSGLGPKTFQQAAGFIRVRESANPLDGSAVHPEQYGVVEQIASDLNIALSELVGNAALAAKIQVSRYVSDDIGMMTLNDIISELQKPGRDPRAQFEPPKFNEAVFTIQDLKPGMILDGVVTNVTNFGAFVDIGVHQDGLVHISALSNQFVRNPSDVVSIGQHVRVRVIDIDLPLNRIALSCRLDDAPGEKKTSSDGKKPTHGKNAQSRKNAPSSRSNFSNNPFAGLKR